MHPIEPKNATHELAPPAGMADCIPLAVRVSQDTDCRTFTSAWQPSAEELESLRKGASVAVTIFGNSHPPIYVGVE